MKHIYVRLTYVKSLLNIEKYVKNILKNMQITNNIYMQIIKLLQKEKNINVNILKIMLYNVI